MARFQINFISGLAIHPPQQLEGSYAEAKAYADAEVRRLPPGSRYHIRIWRSDAAYPSWAPCDDPEYREC